MARSTSGYPAKKAQASATVMSSTSATERGLPEGFAPPAAQPALAAGGSSFTSSTSRR